jgi:hypothetical protein
MGIGSGKEIGLNCRYYGSGFNLILISKLYIINGEGKSLSSQI